jgi:phosphoribosylformylglycinamidine cyclo-ligase
MRAKEDFTYVIHELPPAMPLFEFLQSQMNVNDGEMFGNYNMGAGFAIYTPQDAVSETIATAAEHGYTAWHAGKVESGPKRVVIEPAKIMFTATTLGVRR